MSLNREFDFLILVRVHNNYNFARNNQLSNDKLSIAHSHFVIAKGKKFTNKQSTQVVEYNGKLNLNDDDKCTEFINFYLPYNKLSI